MKLKVVHRAYRCRSEVQNDTIRCVPTGFGVYGSGLLSAFLVALDETVQCMGGNRCCGAGLPAPPPHQPAVKVLACISDASADAVVESPFRETGLR